MIYLFHIKIYLFSIIMKKNKITNIIGDWGLGIGDWGWGLGPIPNPQSPIPNPQSPFENFFNERHNKCPHYKLINNNILKLK